jgi:hypothetical protein
MTFPDLANGILESLGGFFIALSCAKLYREKIVRGVSWIHVSFFSVWGVWNLYYYPHLDQWLSFFGGTLLFTMQFVWLCQIVYYNWRNKPHVMTAFLDDAPLNGKRYRHCDK